MPAAVESNGVETCIRRGIIVKTFVLLLSVDLLLCTASKNIYSGARLMLDKLVIVSYNYKQAAVKAACKCGSSVEQWSKDMQ